MRLKVANRDRTGDLARSIAEAARVREQRGPAPRFLSPQHSALSLRDATNQGEFLDRFIRLVHIRHGVDTAPFRILRKPGFVRSLRTWFETKLWNWLRYQHDRVVNQQNMINDLIIAGLELENDRFRREIDELKQRLARLEKKG